MGSGGICTTCDFQGECISYKNSKEIGKPVLSCEEFGNSGGSGRNFQKIDRLPAAAGDMNDAAPESRSAKGLCMNCNDDKICTFPGVGDSVIFCEEHSTDNGFERMARASGSLSGYVPILNLNGYISGRDS